MLQLWKTGHFARDCTGERRPWDARRVMACLLRDTNRRANRPVNDSYVFQRILFETGEEINDVCLGMEDVDIDDAVHAVFGSVADDSQYTLEETPVMTAADDLPAENADRDSFTHADTMLSEEHFAPTTDITAPSSDEAVFDTFFINLDDAPDASKSREVHVNAFFLR